MVFVKVVLGQVFSLCPVRFHWQAYEFQRTGLPVKMRRPAKFAPPTAPSGRGGKVIERGVLINVKRVGLQMGYYSCVSVLPIPMADDVFCKIIGTILYGRAKDLRRISYFCILIEY